MRSIKTHITRGVSFVKQTWEDMEYANRRLLETDLGIPFEKTGFSRRTRPEIRDSETRFRR